MKVKCINDSDFALITKGEIYFVEKEIYDCYYIRTQYGLIPYEKENFEVVEIVEDSIKEATSPSLADQVRALELENQELKLKLEQIKKLL